MIKNGYMKYWTRTTAITLLIIGAVTVAAGVVVAFLAPDTPTYSWGFLCGIFIGIGLALIANSVVWLIRSRGMTDEQAKAHFKQMYDERYNKAFSQATQISTLITVIFLMTCGVIFLVQLQQTLVGWLFMGGGYLMVISRGIITRIILRRS